MDVKYFPLVWSSLMRRRARTVFTLASVVVAFLLFGLLDSVRMAFVDVGDTLAGARQLITLSNTGFSNPLPVGLEAQIRNVPGVAGVARASFFGGFYQNTNNSIGGTAVRGNYFAVNDAFTVPPAQLKAFQSTRNGILVAARIAKRFGWRIGDQVPLIAPEAPRLDGSDAWTFDVVGTFNDAKARASGMGQDIFVRWKYVDTARAFNHGTADWFQKSVTDPASADRVADAIDRLSTNSDHQTTTRTLNSFITSLVNQTANIGLIVAGIMAAVFFTLVLLTGNTMAQAFRERTREVAVLKTIGFRGSTIMELELAGSMLMMTAGGVLGMLAAMAVISGLKGALGATMPISDVNGSTWASATGLMVLIGLLAGALPMIRALRLKVVAALAGR